MRVCQHRSVCVLGDSFCKYNISVLVFALFSSLVPPCSIKDHQVQGTTSATADDCDEKKSLKPPKNDVLVERSSSLFKVLPSPDPDLVSGSIR